VQIKLTKEQMEAFSDKLKAVNVDGGEWLYISKDGEPEEDENGKYNYYIYQRQSDSKYFRITVFLCRYRHKDYGYEDYMQDKTAYEVEKKEITITQWVSVK
jgi:hypothetical protein